MKSRDRSNQAVFRMFVLSAFLHAAIFLLYQWLSQGASIEQSIARELQVVTLLRKKVEEPVEPEEALPDANEIVVKPELKPEESVLIDHEIKRADVKDEFASDNQEREVEGVFDYGAKQEVVEKKEAAFEKGARDLVAAENEHSVAIETNKGVVDLKGQGEEILDVVSVGEAETGAALDELYEPPNDLEIPPELLGNLGNMSILSDRDLGNKFVTDPFSNKKSKELKLVNRYLVRMGRQILSYWVNPYSGPRKYSGIIKMTVDPAGYLQRAFIFRPSGNSLLDVSVLDAIRSVPRYAVPEDEAIAARYYTNLEYSYSSHQEEIELMPFEYGYRKDKE